MPLGKRKEAGKFLAFVEGGRGVAGCLTIAEVLVSLSFPAASALSPSSPHAAGATASSSHQAPAADACDQCSVILLVVLRVILD